MPLPLCNPSDGKNARFLSGTLLADDRYRIIEYLGKGLQGEVYKAEDLLLGIQVALKFPSRRVWQDSALRETFLREAQIARRVTHQNVCRVHDVGISRDRPFVTMELYDRTLTAVLRQVSRLAPEAALRRGLELCHGLAAIHAQGILHCDLKPCNVMVNDLGQIRISDFGLARYANLDAGPEGGTPMYMAPELFAGSPATVQSDIYALGLVVYEMVTGQPARRQVKPEMTWKEWAVIVSAESEPGPPSNHVAGLDPTLESLILNCLAKDPRQRPVAAMAMAEVLERRETRLEPTPDLITTESAPLSSEEDERALDAFLHRVAADHEVDRPILRQSRDVFLKKIYVEPQIELLNPGLVTNIGVFEGVPLSFRELLELETISCPWVTRRWLLCGDRGAGKTTLLRQFAARLAAAGGKPWVPFFRSLPQWLREGGPLFDRADARLGHCGHRHGVLSALLERLMSEGRLLILLDGLDEVPRSSRAEARRALRDLAREQPETPIVATGRPAGVDSPHPDFIELSLQPFDRKRRRVFLHRWLDNRSEKENGLHASELLAVMEADHGELGGNPLYLSLRASLVERSDDWKARRLVFERIPELVGGPGQALAVVDQLRRCTRDGSDLFFLARTAAEIGRKWRQSVREAGRLLQRFFDHIPPPPEELFRQVETPHDGLVELWREVPAGHCLLGSPSGEGFGHERPCYPLKVTANFRIAAVPVTNAQYAAFDPFHRWNRWGELSEEELSHHPVVDVPWFAAMAFCRWLSQALPELRGARLPVEEEWEYAGRAGTQTRYWSGDAESDLARVGWYRKNSGGRTHRVGEKPGSPWNLYDVHGNVWEWTLSEWTDDYVGREKGIEIDPKIISDAEAANLTSRGGLRVVRGGGFRNRTEATRTAHRLWDPELWQGVQGFRVLLPHHGPGSDSGRMSISRPRLSI